VLVDRWRRIESLFHEALSKTPEERRGFLAEACSGDSALQREVESLLAHESLAGDFLESDGSGPKAAASRDLVTAGQPIGPYTVIELLGAGGMGEVYRAQDQRLEREVALKFLSNRIADDASSIERFHREARAVSALNHPNICTMHDVGESHGRRYIVMELLEGQSLKDRIAAGPLSMRELASIGSQVCAALQAAHDKGIVHRDLKPANIFVSKTGRVKVLDFGLAKREADAPLPNAQIDGATRSLTLTGAGSILGTLAYMSPEQAVGEKVDGRSDLFSLAVVLYEMATGRRPFGGKTSAGTLGSLLTESPARPSAVNSGVPRKLDRVILRGLEKSAESRYASAGELSADLAPWVDSGHIRRNTWIAAVMSVMALAAGAFLLISSWQRERQRVAADVRSLIEHEQYASAFLRAKAAGSAITEDQWAAMSSVVSIETTPRGAEIRWKDYSTPDAAWQSLGRSPVAHVRLPTGALRVAVSKSGFETLERVLIKWNNDLHDAAGEVNLGQYGDRIHFELSKVGALPPGMVVVPAGLFGSALFGFKPVPMDTYLIDKYEVTNRQYKEFVDKGGYQNRAWWEHPIVQDGRELSWEEAMHSFRDATGRPGPATWAGGAYPPGQDDYPVGGVSWYEAAAYAEFAGKSLPTLQHWDKAALVWMAPRIIPLSNFHGAGPVPVGRTQALSPFGTYDMAGNVKEWCWNEEQPGKRYLLGGAWDSEGDWYAFGQGEARPATDRLSTSGFRCVRYTSPPPKGFTAPVIRPAPRDYANVKPVPDEIFETYRSLYLYEHRNLDAKVEAVEQSPAWRKEKVTFRAAYGDERMAAYLFVPKSSQPPYQAVVFMPWVTAMYASSSANLVCMEWVNFVIKSGRAVLYPVYHGTYERSSPPWHTDIGYRDWVIMTVKDLGRSIDYLETRPDIRKDSLGYYGASMGAQFGPYLAVEGRIKTAVLADGAFLPWRLKPEVDPVTFAPRVKIPVLMINGRYDWVEPLEETQNPMFRAFGTPEKDKRHVLLETTHYSLLAGEPFVREVLGWFDKYLGPVK
jgi:serine/threonine protein kinase/dienelactone hydrolase